MSKGKKSKILKKLRERVRPDNSTADLLIEMIEIQDDEIEALKERLRVLEEST